MAFAIWTTVVLGVAALATAMTLGWRRYTALPIKSNREICGPTCYPRVNRGGQGH